MIERLIVLNGYQANFNFEIGKVSDVGSTVVRIVKNPRSNDYTVYLEDGREVEANGLNVLVIRRN